MSEVGETICARFHSLGDVVLTTGILREVARLEGRAVSILTEARFAPIFDGLPFIDRLWTREAPPRDQQFRRVIDLQGSGASARILDPLGPRRVLRGRGLARRWTVVWGDRRPRLSVPHVLARYAEAAGLPREEATMQCRPEVAVTPSEAARASEQYPGLLTPPRSPRVALLTGASRRSKAYPTERFLEVGRRLEEAGCEVLWFEAPGQATRTPWMTVRAELGSLKALLATASLAVSNDSGPMHLASALGVPVVAIFGSSVRRLGFAPTGPRDQLIEAEDVACRPCGVHGRDQCWLGHWRCLRDVAAERVVKAALSALLNLGFAVRASEVGDDA
ncbi:MAG: glycosyltransferase family 9 protein [Candidatus Eisenbacteria bacterium]